MVGRGTTQPSSQKGSVEVETEDNLFSMEREGDKGEGDPPTSDSAGEDYGADT